MGLMAIGFYTPTIPAATPDEKLMPAPALVVQAIDGKTIDLQQQKGKVVFINFWATWCPPCLAELPAVNELYSKIKDNQDIVFVTIDVDNKLGNSTAFLKNKDYQLPVYGGNLNGLPKTFYSGTIPTTLVIDKKGFVIFNNANKANYASQRFIDYLVGLSKK